MFLPPTAIYRLLDQPNVRDVDYSSLKCFVSSAAPISTRRLRQAIEVFGPVMAQSYGQTEGIAITFMYPEEHFVDGKIAPDSRLSSAGRPVPLLNKVVIMDDDHRAVPAGRTGEICVRGDGLMKGYYKAPYATARTIVDGWLHTGDVGFLDEEGYLHIVDRKKDMIISGGFNVYPGEIEQMISSLDGVRDCAVIGVPDDDWGEAVKAVVERSSGRIVAGEEIIARCKERLGSVKAPKSVDFIEQLPRSAAGKVLKRELRDMYWMSRERKI
jgi:acyl-CoA synthetase (AMP-forming)/AMP-acid ligase II